jgi:Double-stranded DNA deaminase toxin A
VPLEEVTAGLNAALDHLDRARQRLAEGVREWTGAARLYRDTLQGSQKPKPNAVRASITTLDTTTFRQLYTTLLTIEAGIRQLLLHYGGQRTPQPTPPAPGRPPPAGPAAITNRHGNRYPPVAAGLADNLPARVVPRTGQRTVGVPRIAGQVAAPIEAGYDPALSPAVNRRLAQMGIASEFLDAHVEMKIGAKMIQTGQRDVEVCINNVPCGIEVQRTWPDVCDKILDEFLPAGYTLRVYGTTKDNQPFTRTYGRTT